MVQDRVLLVLDCGVCNSMIGADFNKGRLFCIGELQTGLISIITLGWCCWNFSGSEWVKYYSWDLGRRFKD